MAAAAILCMRAACLGAVFLSACTVGSPYRPPPAVAHEARFARADSVSPRVESPGVESPGVATPGVETPGVSQASSWWRSLADAELERLITRALAQSPDIDAGLARLQKARMTLREAGAAELPKFSAAGSALRSDANLSTTTRGLQFYFAGFDASWEVDLFGRARSGRAAAAAQSDAMEAELSNLEVSLAAEVARTYVELRANQALLDLVHRSLDTEQRMFDLTLQRRAQGAASDLEVERLRTLVESTRGMAIPAEQGIEQSMDALAVLTGSPPGTLDAELAAPTPLPDLPASVSIGDPAEMLRRRPDVRAAERQIAARTALRQVRVAELFPQVNLLGSIGYGSNSLGGLFHDASLIFFAAPVLQWNFLDFGASRARVGEAAADVDEALALYRKAVLGALQDAEDSLSRFGHARQTVMSLEHVRDSAERAAQLAAQRRTAGALSVIDQLDTERTRLTAEEDLLRSRAALVEEFIGLQKSLGLGWERGG